MLTNNQRECLEHTKKNRYFLSDGAGKDHQDLEVLRGLGFVSRQDAPEWMCGDYCYTVTAKGSDYLRGGE